METLKSIDVLKYLINKKDGLFESYFNLFPFPYYRIRFRFLSTGSGTVLKYT